MYCIYWRSKLTDATGRGTVGFSLTQAEQIAKRLNEQIPELQHWTEPFMEVVQR